MNQFKKYHQAFINNVYIEALSSLNTSCVSVKEEQVERTITTVSSLHILSLILDP